MFDETALYEYADRLTALRGREDQIFKLVLDNKTIKDLIVFLNTDQQMGEEHVDSLGKALFNRISERTTYSLFDRKRRGGQPYKLFDEGDYWASYRATIGVGFILIESNPMKGTDNLEEMFGDDLEGLTDESLTALIQQAHEFYIRWYIKTLLP